jgi:hypothetical protein
MGSRQQAVTPLPPLSSSSLQCSVWHLLFPAWMAVQHPSAAAAHNDKVLRKLKTLKKFHSFATSSTITVV